MLAILQIYFTRLSYILW